jgi:hypothetical protein
VFISGVLLFTQQSKANDAAAKIIKKGGSVMHELKIIKKKQNPLERAVSFLDYEPNAFTTGFLVGDGLVITAYHATDFQAALFTTTRLKS